MAVSDRWLKLQTFVLETTGLLLSWSYCAAQSCSTGYNNHTGWPQKSQPLPTDKKIVLNHIKTCQCDYIYFSNQNVCVQGLRAVKHLVALMRPARHALSLGQLNVSSLSESVSAGTSLRCCSTTLSVRCTRRLPATITWHFWLVSESSRSSSGSRINGQLSAVACVHVSTELGSWSMTTEISTSCYVCILTDQPNTWSNPDPNPTTIARSFFVWLHIPRTSVTFCIYSTIYIYIFKFLFTFFSVHFFRANFHDMILYVSTDHCGHYWSETDGWAM